MRHLKKKLITIAKKVETKSSLTPSEIEYLLTFEKVDRPLTLTRILKVTAVPLSLIFGFFFTVFPENFELLIERLPEWTNLSPQLLAGVNYFWDLLGDPVEQANILYHIPNVILYSFGIFGIKKLIEIVEHKSWLDKVLLAQEKLRNYQTSGELNLRLPSGHSMLFVGAGDYIGMQFALDSGPTETITISNHKPNYTDVWNFYDVNTFYEDLETVIVRSSGQSCGEYVFFPVKDDQIFLPGDKDYDVSPHKLDLLCQNIRTIEKSHHWKSKRILIIGDRFHKSYVRSEDQTAVIKKSEDVISLSSVASKYENVSIIDPSDVVIRNILKIANGRKIVFRATREGIKEYKTRFYDRLKLMGYKPSMAKKGTLTIGYDLFEDQTEQQTLSRKIDGYLPVVLSKNVKDALIRNGYKESEFLYVPALVLDSLTKEAERQ